jgi:hypothetical protein
VNEFVSLYFKTPSPDMWVKIVNKFKEVLEKTEQQLLKKAKSNNLSLIEADLGFNIFNNWDFLNLIRL